MKILCTAVVVVAALMSSTAQAGVTISVGPHQNDPTSGKISPYWGLPTVFMETFDLPGGGCGLNAPASSVSGGPWGIVQGSLQAAYAAPAGDSSCYAYAPVHNGIGQYPGSALPAGTAPGVLSVVDINYQPLISTLPAGTYLNYFGLYYGSIDTYNTLEFYSGNTKVATITGKSILAACGSSCTSGDRTSDDTNVFVNLYFTEDVEFTRLRFFSTGVAVEVDNLTAGFNVTPVPEPPAMLLAAGGLMALAAVVRRRSRSS
ncbi:hypothetical protein [Pelomonas sp. KK5]|uniref:Npun_F0296 family exosortase-dependent surface protein n=1 Tax=Pelomonas sp. KK5 TaxID=1855730 RepID=UPI00097BC7B1|nr:hypothetical protein [Pelomonas sp. KK5]